MSISFKTPSLRPEFDFQLDSRLRAMLFEFDHYASFVLGHNLIITHICRSQAEQNRLYASEIAKGKFYMVNGEKWYSEDGKSPTLSVHQTKPCRGIDIHNNDWPQADIDKALNYVNGIWRYGRGLNTLISHNVEGQHFHMQVAV